MFSDQRAANLAGIIAGGGGGGGRRKGRVMINNDFIIHGYDRSSLLFCDCVHHIPSR